MGKFRDFMAKGVNMQSNLPLARHIVGLSVVDNMSPRQISQDPEVQSQGALPSDRAVYRVLNRYGVTPEVKAMMKQAQRGAEEKAQVDYDKYHNRNLFGKNPERDYASQRVQQAQQGEPLPVSTRAFAAPPGFVKVRAADGQIWLRPQHYEVQPGEKVLHTRAKDYGKILQTTPRAAEPAVPSQAVASTVKPRRKVI